MEVKYRVTVAKRRVLVLRRRGLGHNTVDIKTSQTQADIQVDKVLFRGNLRLNLNMEQSNSSLILRLSQMQLSQILLSQMRLSKMQFSKMQLKITITSSRVI